MHKTAFIILSTLTLGCAGQAKVTKSTDKIENSKPLTINITNPERIASPFKNEADEEMFWKIMNNEVDLEKIDPKPSNKIAVILMMALSYEVPDMIRVQAFNALMAKSSQMMDQSTKETVEKAFDSDNLAQRIGALRLIFEYDVDALNILRHVLKDAARLGDFVEKQEAKVKATTSTPPQNQNRNPDQIPSPNDGKLEHNHQYHHGGIFCFPHLSLVTCHSTDLDFCLNPVIQHRVAPPWRGQSWA